MNGQLRHVEMLRLRGHGCHLFNRTSYEGNVDRRGETINILVHSAAILNIRVMGNIKHLD